MDRSRQNARMMTPTVKIKPVGILLQEQLFSQASSSGQGGKTVGEAFEVDGDADAFFRRLEDDEGG